LFRFVNESSSFVFFSYATFLFNFLDIEEEGCESTYVQWVQTHSSNSDDNNGKAAIMVSDSLLSSTSNKDFECEQGQPGKFR